MIRPVTPDDMPALKAVIEANDLFPPDLLDDMIVDYFNNVRSDDIWLTDEGRLNSNDHRPIATIAAPNDIKEEARPTNAGQPVAIAYCAPERMTQGTWNLYLIAVHPHCQGQGYGAAMMGYVEQLLASCGERVLLVETSGLPSYARTRRFYRKCGYDEEARIREFYQTGEDKIIFRKALT